MVYYTTNVNSMEAKLFTIRCGINHAIQLQDISHIIVVTDTIPAAKWIFDMSTHPYQLYSIMILKDFKAFLTRTVTISLSSEIVLTPLNSHHIY